MESPATSTVLESLDKRSIPAMTDDLEIVWESLATKRKYNEYWHLSYGLTENRGRALGGPPKNSGSLKNPNSETALTIFLLGHLDKWSQSQKSELPLPRTKISGRLDKNFFKTLKATSDDKANSNKEAENNSFLDEIGRQQLSRLLFEIGVPNIAFSENAESIRSSFIDHDLPPTPAGAKRKWSQFDAMLFVPTEKRIFGIEAKLGSDISVGTTNYPYVNQIIRNLEAGYWLTKCDHSLFYGWEFHYAFICPESAMEYKATHYSHILTKKEDPCVETAINNYKNFLCAKNRWDKNVDQKDFECFKNYFTDKENNHITVHYWSDLAKSLIGRVPNPMKSLYDHSDFKHASGERFELADISDCHYR